MLQTAETIRRSAGRRSEGNVLVQETGGSHSRARIPEHLFGNNRGTWGGGRQSPDRLVFSLDSSARAIVSNIVGIY